jgi:hypothetical protein
MKLRKLWEFQKLQKLQKLWEFMGINGNGIRFLKFTPKMSWGED